MMEEIDPRKVPAKANKEEGYVARKPGPSVAVKSAFSTSNLPGVDEVDILGEDGKPPKILVSPEEARVAGQ
jgi:hypothetical protein